MKQLRLLDALELPKREEKPRQTGVCSVLDPGLPTELFQDMIESHGQWIDWVKFGWGTALVTKDIQKKLTILKHHNIEAYFGGTLFEKCVQQNVVDDYYRMLDDVDIQWLEISDGTLSIARESKLNYIRQASEHFNVLSEVGFKDPERSEAFYPSEWIEAIQLELAAGAYKCVTEARESGSSGICRSNGELRFGLIHEMINSDLNIDSLVFETPNKMLQKFFIEQIGANVNLANISLFDVVGLETLRLGLRSDTFFVAHKGAV